MTPMGGLQRRFSLGVATEAVTWATLGRNRSHMVQRRGEQVESPGSNQITQARAPEPSCPGNTACIKSQKGKGAEPT